MAPIDTDDIALDTPQPADEAEAPVTLLGPDGEPLRTKEVWPSSDWRKLDASMKIAGQYNITLIAQCALCGEWLSVTTAGDGSRLLECACKVRRWQR
jgi:hypothetical protein